jgi:hypothetical protein
MKTFGFGVAGLGFFAVMIGACGASGNPVSGGDGTGTGAGTSVVDSGATTTSYGDSGTGALADSGTSSVIDSGSTPIDSGSTTPPVDAGVVFTGGGTCDITNGLTISIDTIATFVLDESPASCGSGKPCDASHCCLDIAAASGGGSLPIGPTGICLTSIDLSGLGL